MVNLKQFGWRLFQIRVPEDWEMTAEGGGRGRTYIRLEDEQMVRLEVRWDDISPKKEPNVKKSLDSFLNELKERVEKANLKFTRLGLREIEVAGHEGYLYHVRGGGELLGASWYCNDSRRLFVVQVHFRTEEYERMREIFQSLLESVVCHGRKWWTWSVYAFRFELPEEYELYNYRLLSMYGRLSFRSKRDVWYVFAYQGMANVILEERYNGDLKKWFKDAYLKEALKQYSYYKLAEEHKLSLKGHEGRRLIFKPRLSFLKKIVLDSFLWLCDVSNRILVMSVVAPEKVHSVISSEKERVLESFTCH